MTNRNLGKFTLSEKIVRGTPEKAFEILSMLKFVPMRAEFLSYEGTVEYIGISPKFEEVPMGMKVPEYTLELYVSNDKEGKETLEQVEARKY